MATPGAIAAIQAGSTDEATLQYKQLNGVVSGRTKVVLTDGAADVNSMFPQQHEAQIGACAAGDLLRLTNFSSQALPNGTSVLIVHDFAKVAKAELAAEPTEVATPAPAARPAEVVAAGEPAAKRAKLEGSPSGQGLPSPLLSSGALLNKRVMPIMSVNPYNSWTIKGRLSAKSDVRMIRGGPKRLFDCEVTDADGVNIRITFWDELADKYHAALQEDRVYVISGGNMRQANKQYNNTRAPYEITASAGTKIVEDTDAAADANFGQLKLEFVGLEKLPAHVGKKSTVDILFVVKEAYELSSVTRKADGAALSKRDLLVMDESAKTVRLTLWGKMATETAVETGDVCELSRVKVGDWGGVSLSSVGASKITVNPTNDKANELKAWYESTGRDASVESLGAGLEGAAAGGARQDKSVSCGELEELGGNPDKPDWVVCRGVVMKIGNEKAIENGPWYTACPEAGIQSKVTEDGSGRWFCEKNGKHYDTCERRFIISVRMMDATGNAWVQCYNDEAVQLIGTTADELHSLKETDDEKYKSMLKANSFSLVQMKMMVKDDVYNGETRKRISCKRLQPLDYASEARRLLDSIKAMKGGEVK